MAITVKQDSIKFDQLFVISIYGASILYNAFTATTDYFISESINQVNRLCAAKSHA